MANIVITGSSRGLGLEMAKKFLEADCHVALSGRSETPGSEILSLPDAWKDRWIYVTCDVQDQSALQNLWNVVVDKWGQIDIWINNAGQNAPHSYVFDTETHYLSSVIATNLTGMIIASQVASIGMIRQKHGAIYNMEGLGSNNMIQPKTIIYGTTKHALTYFTKGLAKELDGTGVIASRLSPGMMLTDFITKTPDDKIAALYSDERFRRIFNILADKPETVATFLVPKMLANKKNDAHIVWLTGLKAAVRFMCAPFSKRNLV